MTFLPFLIYMFGSLVILTGFADIILEINKVSLAALEEEKEVVCSQSKEEFINFHNITRCM